MAGQQTTGAGAYVRRFQPVAELLPREHVDDDPLYGEFGREYYPAVYGDRLHDRSFSVSAPHGGHALIECDLLEGTLGRFGMPIRVIVTDTEPGRRRRLIREAIKTIQEIADDDGAEAALVADRSSGEVLSEVGLACLAAGGRLCARMHAVIDLAKPERDLHADVRRSVKAQLNWGSRSLELRHCNAENPDRSMFDTYRALHRQVAGRVTRGEASWNVMFDVVRRGRGELTLATLAGELVGGLLVVDGEQMCHYASAAYVRSHFDRPLAHWPVMDAVVRSRRRGMRWFEVGEVFFAGERTAKEQAIGAFKKGFTSRLELRSHWRLPPSRAGEEGSRSGAA